ncbi:MAG: precorrin-6A synthase (deacetylating) [Pseudomonadota bacterium]
MTTCRQIRVIGIGAGNPDYMTVQAINALNASDALFIPNKGDSKSGLADIRRDICERFLENTKTRMIDYDMPDRNNTSRVYADGVRSWRDDVEDVYSALIRDELGEHETGAFLVWGDPSLYDGTLTILETILDKGDVAFDYEVIPGISSVQALAARHKVPINRIGDASIVTTGRRLAREFPENAGTVTVMLDSRNAYKSVNGDVTIHWGAYVGTADEILVSGRLCDVSDEIEEVRKQARDHHGWIMDTYILTKPDDGEAD